MMQFKAVNGNRKQPKLFAQFVESLTTTDLQAENSEAMGQKITELIKAFTVSHPKCNFYVQKGSHNWYASRNACFIYENYNAYLSKTALLTIVGIEGSQVINVGDTQNVSVSFNPILIDATTGEATLGDVNAIAQSLVEKNSITSTFKI